MQGSRRFGDITEGRKNVMTFIYELHHSLALGEVGIWIFGIVALLWTIDCFVGAFLTFPAVTSKRARPSKKSWLSRWWPAWLLKTNQLFSLVFTWHRASGLWVWGMLLVFAWSAVALNLGEQVYDPVMSVFLSSEEWDDEVPELPTPRETPRIPPREAREIGRRLMLEETAKRGAHVLGERWLYYSKERGAYNYGVESTLDISDRLAETTVYFDGDDGRFLSFYSRRGLNTKETVTTWLVGFHFGSVREGGLAYRIFVFLLGILVTLLSVTGVWIWWRKRRAHRKSAEHRVKPGLQRPVR